MIFLPIAMVVGVSCMVGFIIVMARPPHTFTPVAKGLLAAFLILYFGSPLFGAAWLFFVEIVMYRMWLASFKSGWVETNTGWWGQYVRLERWLGSVEYAVYTRIKKSFGTSRKA